MDKKKAYLSIPITGRHYSSVQKELKILILKIEKLGYEVITPFDLAPEQDRGISYYMGKDIEALLQCDVIFMAPDWYNSKGCNAEYAIAKIYGKEIIGL